MLKYDISLFLQLILLPPAIYFIICRSRIQFDSSLLSALLFFAWILISSSWAPSGVYPIKKVSLFVFYSIPCYAIGRYVLPRSQNTLLCFYTLIAVFGLIVCFECVRQYLLLQGGIGRVMGANYLVTGQTLGMGLISLFTLRRYVPSSSLARYILYAFIAVMYVMLFQLGARGPFIAVTLCFLVWGAENFTNIFKHLLTKKGGFLLLGFILGMRMLWHYKSTVSPKAGTFASFSERMQGVFNGHLDEAILERLDYYASALTCIHQHPWFGVGLGGWPSYYGFPLTKDIHPHNIFLEVGAEAGLIGMSFLVFFLISHAKRVVQLFSDPSPLSQATFYSLLFCFLNTLKTGDLKINLFFFTLIGVSSCLLMQNSQPEAKSA